VDIGAEPSRDQNFDQLVGKVDEDSGHREMLKRKYVSISIPEGRNRQGKISINLLAVVEASNWLYRVEGGV
jgi:hypothetical protein